MAVEAPLVREPRISPRERLTTPTRSGPWTPTVLARVLSALLPGDIGEDQVQERAIGLGLLRQPELAGRAELTAQSVSRLLLVGYQLPAQVEPGTFSQLRDHLSAGRLIFVLQAEPEPSGEVGLTVVQVLTLVHEPFRESWLALAEPGRPGDLPMRRTLDSFRRFWAPTGGSLIVAARRWSDLPSEGRLFFGGLREADGTFHWNMAECDTDATGNIWRF